MKPDEEKQNYWEETRGEDTKRTALEEEPFEGQTPELSTPLPGQRRSTYISTKARYGLSCLRLLCLG
jgi:hypothetical protein